jgi:Na+/proline symporter
MTFKEALSITLPTGILLLVFIAIGIYSFFKIKNVDHFFFGTKEIGIFSFASNIFGANFSFITAVFVLLYWSYMFGWNVFWTIVTAVAGMILFSMPRVTPVSDEFLKNGTTLHEYIAGKQTSFSAVRMVSALVTVITLLGFVAAQVYIFSGFLSVFISISPFTISIVIFVFLVGYTLLGGFDSVIRTDILQSILIAAGCIALYKVVGNLSETTDAKISDIVFAPLPAFYIPMLIVINGLWQFSAMDMWQRSVASRKLGVVRIGSALGGVFFVVASVFVVILGLYLRAIHQEAGAELVSDPFVLISSIIIPGDISAIFLFALFVSAFLSTADSMLIAASQALMTDIYSIKTDNVISLGQVRMSVFALGLLGFILNLAIFKYFPGESVIAFLLTFFSCQVVLLPSIGVRTYLPSIKITHYPMLISILSGLVFALAMGAYTTAKPDIQNLIPVASLFVSAFVLFSFMPFCMVKE